MTDASISRRHVERAATVQSTPRRCAFEASSISSSPLIAIVAITRLATRHGSDDSSRAAIALRSRGAETVAAPTIGVVAAARDRWLISMRPPSEKPTAKIGSDGAAAWIAASTSGRSRHESAQAMRPDVRASPPVPRKSRMHASKP